MIIVTGTMQVASDAIDRFAEAAQAVTRVTLLEPGCHLYAFHQSLDDPTLFRVYEEWEDTASLKAHGASDHIAAFRNAIGGIVLSREIKMIEPERITPL